MRSILLSYATAATALAAATFVAPPPAQAMTVATPAALKAAIQEANVTQPVHCCGRRYSYAYWPYYAYAYRPYHYAYTYRPYYAYSYWPYTYTSAYTYRPYYSYAYTYRPYYSWAYAYRPSYAYAYAYRPYTYTYAYRPYRAYAYAGYGRRHWIGWRGRWW
jgi:hypothetical protein